VVHTIVVGINYRDSSIGEQEQFSISGEKLPGTLHRYHALPFMHEIIILSTCNRVEFYCYTSDIQACADTLRRDFFSSGGLESQVYVKRCDEAVKYLYRVASGVESMVFGEREILIQVRHAYERAVSEKTVGPVFNKLFQSAVATAKKIATDTDIRKGKQSVVSVAVERALELCPRERPAVGIIGAGKTGASAADIVHKRCIGETYISNRSSGRGEQVSHRYGARFIPFDRVGELIDRSDIIITGLSVERPIFSSEHFADSSRPKYVMDIGVPRNVEASVGDLKHVTLLNIHDFKKSIDQTIQAKKEEIGKVVPIVEEEFQKFLSWYDYRRTHRVGKGSSR
jgi:glutamyl-tRNA reductase